MSSRQVIQGIFLAAGIAILVLLFMPAVHAPFVVMHGPMTALRAQRAAWMIRVLLQAAAFLFAGLLLPLPLPLLHLFPLEFGALPVSELSPLRLSCTLRC